jgi:hypothetical protein
MELADQQVSENESGGLTGAEIPVAADVPAREAPAEKLSLRQQIEKNVETVRTEEAQRARAADGKFTKSDGAAEKPATAPIQEEKQEASPEPESKPFAPPPGFSPETKAFLATLPADHPIKRDIEKREGEVSNGIKTYSDKAKQYDAIEQVIAPVRQTFQQAGIQNDAEAIKALLGWEASFRNPATRTQAFHNLARQYGLDPSTLVPSSSGTPSAAQDIPDSLRPVIDQFGNVQQQVQGLDSRLQTFEQNQTAREVTAFAKDKPHFEKVRSRMASLMSPALDTRGQIIAPAAAQTLDEAYQQAIWMDPEIRQQMLDDQAKAKAEELARTNAEKVRRAEAAAVSPSTRPPAGAPVEQAATGTGVRGSIHNAIKVLREEQRA